jgi:hypothetical protein
MTKSIALKVVYAALSMVLIASIPQFAFASGAHGGGGGGGFHGGGGGGFHGGGLSGGGGAHYAGGYHGGGYYGGYHGGGYGWHGGGYYGHGGWGRGYWGYPGYGWGFSVGFNFGPFWGGYGYPYGYAYSPYYYPYYYPYPYAYPYPYYVPAAPAGSADSASPSGNQNSYPSGQSSNYVPDDSSAQQYRAPAQPSSVTTPPSATNAVTIRNASYTTLAPNYRAHPVAGVSSDYRPASSTKRQLTTLRPEVQNVIRALRAMPPAARERQLDSGRYGNLTPQELQIVRYAADLPPA